VLCTRYGGTADEAFALLIERSKRVNVKLRDIASRILDELPQRRPAAQDRSSVTSQSLRCEAAPRHDIVDPGLPRQIVVRVKYDAAQPLQHPSAFRPQMTGYRHPQEGRGDR
jgi:hypothetical protein